jgi:hypothetical protein
MSNFCPSSVSDTPSLLSVDLMTGRDWAGVDMTPGEEGDVSQKL